MKIVTVSSKRQITIPADMLLELGAGKKSRLLVQRENGNIVLTPIKKSIVDELGGSLYKYIDPSKRGIPFSKIMEETKRITAKKLAEKL